ncbi:DUF6141 family protein [Bacillus horti]|nr:DUF6141 family protein [Bacillus horti]
MTSSKKIIYKEKQYLPKWIYFIILPFAFLVWGIALVQFITGEPVGNRPMSDTGLIIFTAIFGVLLPLAFMTMKAQVTIYSHSMTIGLTPIFRKKIDFQDIQSVAHTKISPIKEFGGWGIRWNGAKWGLIVEGKEGIEILLRSGSIFVVTSKSPEKIIQVYSSLIDQGDEDE